MDKDLIKNKFYQIIYQLDKKKIRSTKFYLKVLNKAHPLYDGNEITFKILFSNHGKIIKNK